MNDKKEKTFSDLLFSSEEDKHDDSAKLSTFGDIFKSANSFSDHDKDVSLMDSLGSSDTEKGDNKENFDDIFSPVNDDKNVEFDNEDNVSDISGAVKEEVIDEVADNGINKEIFFDKVDNTANENDDLGKEDNINKGLFFDNLELKEEVHDEEKAVQDNHFVENNLFFDTDESKNDDTIMENGSTVKMQEEVKNNDSEQIDLSQSVFFKDNSEVLDNKEEAVVKEEKVVEDEKLVKENVDSNKKNISNDNDVVSSTNPFFDDDKVDDSEKVDANPLFLNTLNLVESDNMKKKVDVIDPNKSKHFDVKIVRKKEPLIKAVIGVISYAIFIWLLFIGLTLLIYVLDIKIRAYKGDYSTPTYNAYVVLTGSMLPEIQVYDVVITKKAKAADLNVGDVITFSSADTRFLGTTITHRIIKKNYDKANKSYTFQTKGDNNNVADSALVPQNNIYGKVILKIPKLGYLQEFLASDGGWIIVILIPCLAVISYDIVKLIKGLKKKKYKNIKVQK